MTDKTDKKLDRKTQIRQARHDARSQGPLYIDPKHLKDGYKYCFASDIAGSVEAKERLGWTIVRDSFDIGDKTAANSSKFHGAVLVKSKCGQTLILMAISDEDHKVIEDVIAEDNAQTVAGINQIDGIDAKNQYGNIQFSNK